MKKMKSGLMMFCLTVLLSCATLMINTGTASAMTLEDLCGDYRLTYVIKWMKDDGAHNQGMIVEWVNEDGDYCGKVKKTVKGAFNRVGDYVITNVYVEGGVIHCALEFTPGWTKDDCIMRVYNNGRTLKIFNTSNEVYWELHRL